MAVQVYTNTYRMGQATVDGLSFPESAIMTTLHDMYRATQAKVDRDGGVTTGPAVIKFVVEQEVIVDE